MPTTWKALGHDLEKAGKQAFASYVPGGRQILALAHNVSQGSKTVRDAIAMRGTGKPAPMGQTPVLYQAPSVGPTWSGMSDQQRRAYAMQLWNAMTPQQRAQYGG